MVREREKDIEREVEREREKDIERKSEGARGKYKASPTLVTRKHTVPTMEKAIGHKGPKAIWATSLRYIQRQ